MANILVTGAAGFIGSHISNHHVQNGDTVFGIDNFCSSKTNSDHYKKLTKQYPKFCSWNYDICDQKQIGNLPNIRFDLVYNFACPASPPIYQRIPIKTLLTCTQGFNNIVNYATYNNTEVKIIHASTSEVYGDAEISPQHEKYWGNVNSYGIRSNYDEGKRAAEALAFDYLNKYNFDVRVVRIFNTYGPHMCQDDGRVVTNFITQMLNDEDITMFGDGLQTRSFCFIDDLLNGILKVADLKHNPKTPINLGNPGEFTMLELVEKLYKLIPESKSKIIYKPLPGDDPKQRKPDITLAKSLLNWEPVIDLETGLSKMISWAKKNNW